MKERIEKELQEAKRLYQRAQQEVSTWQATLRRAEGAIIVLEKILREEKDGNKHNKPKPTKASK